ncbi:MAG: SDR family NAD(P)-dependent oxidoreductase, partial [Deltaproteobacteria bacterium]|nr:SDR family NAD(P)-dependent oxidoreductase [Deltaproteobacteria bacterium]
MLEGKVVVITGSGQGIGKHAARTFAENKAKVVIADFDRDKMQRSAAEIGKLTETLGVHVDVRDEDSVKRMIEQTISRFGQIDVLINNAAIVPHFAWNIPRWPRIADMPMEFWSRVVHTNLYGTFLGSK